MGLQRDALIKLATTWSGPMSAKALPRQKKKIDIEALLRWTYLDELPKRPPQGPTGIIGAWEKVDQWLEELSVAGLCQNGYGVVCDFSAASWPHADAYVVHEAVCALDELDLGLPEHWNPIDDLGDLGELGQAAIARAIDILTVKDASGARRLKQKPRRLVFKHAILGGCPDWEADIPERKFTVGANGKTRWFRKIWVDQESAFGVVKVQREVEGFNHKLRIPYDDAYPEEILDPDPIDSVIGRAEYEIWQASLTFLVDELSHALEDFAPVMSTRSARPWEADVARKPYIWRDLSERPARRPAVSPRAILNIPAARKALERGA